MQAVSPTEHCGRMAVSSGLFLADVGVLLARFFTLSSHSYPLYPPIVAQMDAVHTKVPTFLDPRRGLHYYFPCSKRTTATEASEQERGVRVAMGVGNLSST
jgi:hypothetical protein